MTLHFINGHSHRTCMWNMGFVALFCILGGTALAGVTGLAPVTDQIPASVRDAIVEERAACEQEFAAFQAAADSFNAKKAEDQTDAEYNQVEDLRTDYESYARRYNDHVRRVLLAAKLGWGADQLSGLRSDPGEIEILEMHALAGRLGWDDRKIARMDEEVRKLRMFDKGQLDKTTVAGIWSDIDARTGSQALAKAAAAGSGITVGPGAGTQGNFQDCTIYAMVNATGFPFGVVSARANELLASAGWRSDGERANPQKVIENSGLNGGEVLMLADALGEGEAVQPVHFAETLSEGHPIMVDVYPAGWNGSLHDSHEVVLTRTFTYGGETWYAVADSLHGSQKELYMTAGELSDIIRDSGVAYSPEKGATPAMLHSASGR